MVWAARRAAILMASTSARSSRLDSALSRPLAELGEDDVRQSDQRPERVVQIVRDAARQDAQRLHSLGRRQSLLHAAFVQHARLNQLLPQANALERRGDLVAKRLVTVVPVGIAERDDAQQLVLERQRQDQEALPPVVGQRARRHQLAGGVVLVVGLQQLAVPQAHRRAQQLPVVAGHARQIGRADAGAGQPFDQRAPQRRQVEGDGRLFTDAQQAQVVFVQQQAVLHLAGGGGERDQVQCRRRGPARRAGSTSRGALRAGNRSRCEAAVAARCRCRRCPASRRSRPGKPRPLPCSSARSASRRRVAAAAPSGKPASSVPASTGRRACEVLGHARPRRANASPAGPANRGGCLS